MNGAERIDTLREDLIAAIDATEWAEELRHFKPILADTSMVLDLGDEGRIDDMDPRDFCAACDKMMAQVACASSAQIEAYEAFLVANWDGWRELRASQAEEEARESQSSCSCDAMALLSTGHEPGCRFVEIAALAKRLAG